jgi:hypothetical protein
VAAFLANVGVNAAHAARSPLFADGSFRLLPIPERLPWRRPMLRLQDLDWLRNEVPRSWLSRAVHLDPDLCTEEPTYGDNCRRAGRAFALRRAAPGDLLCFLARLHAPSGQAGFYLVGALEVAEVLQDVTSEPGRGWWDRNAHVLRARATGAWDSFWVFRGTSRSGLLPAAQPFTRRECGAVLGDCLDWRPARTELQTIGSYTRAVRRVTGPPEVFLRQLCG